MSEKPKVRLVLTCGACPEQYDAFIGDKHVGYLRLRHGTFRVDDPNVGGETIYKANPEGDGIFAAHERDYYLKCAVGAILERDARGHPLDKPPAPDVEYEMVGDPEDWGSDWTDNV